MPTIILPPLTVKYKSLEKARIIQWHLVQLPGPVFLGLRSVLTTGFSVCSWNFTILLSNLMKLNPSLYSFHKFYWNKFKLFSHDWFSLNQVCESDESRLLHCGPVWLTLISSNHPANSLSWLFFLGGRGSF